MPDNGRYDVVCQSTGVDEVRFHGFVNRIDLLETMMTGFMWSLIITEIGGFVVLSYGVIVATL